MENGKENNLLWAVGFILLISCGCALFTVITIEDTLYALSHSNSMAMIIVDGGKSFVSDDGTTGEQLTSSKNTLQATLEISYAIIAACAIMGAGLITRVVKRL
jgi:hypothetical protein